MEKNVVVIGGGPAGTTASISARRYYPNASIKLIRQEEKALISEFYSLGASAGFKTPIDSTRLGFFESIISGDSGNPSFLIINGTLVLLTVWTFGGAGSGTNILSEKTAINTMMSTLGGGYSLTEVSLSGLNTY